ncbi:hypothetical protein PAMP_002920 [Pampus punctatissimus]
MESAFLTFILVSSFAVDSSHFSFTDWDDVVVAREGSPTILVCNDTTVRGRGSISINWMTKSLVEKDWKLVLSASERKIFYGGSSKKTMRLTDPNFKVTGNFSLSFLPYLEDCGLYSCLIKQKERKLKEKIILLAVLTDNKVASFTGTVHGNEISTVTLARTPFHLMCPDVTGDIVLLYWKPPDSKNMKLVYQYDRWRDSTSVQSKNLKLAGPPYNAEAGSFSFLLTPELKDGGLYVCDVYLNDNTFSQRTLLSVLKATVVTNQDSSKLTLKCLYSELSKVQSVSWKYQNKSRRLHMLSHVPGIIMTILPLPITSDTAGNYTCTLQLKNGKTVWATVTLPPKARNNGITNTVESHSVTTPYQLAPLSALLVLVPLVAVAVGVLLWRQKHISDRNLIFSTPRPLLSHLFIKPVFSTLLHSQQAPPQGSVYMDLKPRGEDDVYKELERYEQCQS